MEGDCDRVEDEFLDNIGGAAGGNMTGIGMRRRGD